MSPYNVVGATTWVLLGAIVGGLVCIIVPVISVGLFGDDSMENNYKWHVSSEWIAWTVVVLLFVIYIFTVVVTWSGN